MRPLAWLADRLLSVLVPMSAAKQQAFFTESWLADVEADHDSWEPDELWAARRRSAGISVPEMEHPPAGGTGTSAPSDVPPAPRDVSSPSRAGRHSLPDHRTDEQVIEELVEDFRQFITDCFDKRFRN